MLDYLIYSVKELENVNLNNKIFKFYEIFLNSSKVLKKLEASTQKTFSIFLDIRKIRFFSKYVNLFSKFQANLLVPFS